VTIEQIYDLFPGEQVSYRGEPYTYSFLGEYGYVHLIDRGGKVIVCDPEEVRHAIGAE